MHTMARTGSATAARLLTRCAAVRAPRCRFPAGPAAIAAAGPGAGTARSGHRAVRGVDGEGGHEDDGQRRGQGQRQPRREQAGEDPDEGGAEHEGELVRGALIGKGGVQVRGICPAPAWAGRRDGQGHPADPGQRADLRAAGPGHEGRREHRHRGGNVLDPGDEVAPRGSGQRWPRCWRWRTPAGPALAEPVCERRPGRGHRARNRCRRRRPRRRPRHRSR